jgi:AcrR family transcriptional regulator
MTRYLWAIAASLGRDSTGITDFCLDSIKRYHIHVPRGQYDRGLGAAERWARHRAELVRATAAAAVEPETGALSVDAVVRRAGKGRNTFYAHFSGLGEAVRAVDSTVAHAVGQRVDAALVRAVTPGARLHALVSAWLEVARAEPVLMRAALSNDDGRCPELAKKQLASVIWAAERDGLVSRSPDELSLAAGVGALFGVVRATFGRPEPRERVVRSAVDILMRIFR